MSAIQEPNLRCPLTICKWTSLLRAISLLDTTAREKNLPPVAFNDGTYGHILDYVNNQHSRILHANFPKWKKGDLLPPPKKGLAADPVVAKPHKRKPRPKLKNYLGFCRWCERQKKQPGKCEHCGRLSSTWSAKRAAAEKQDA